MITVPTLLILGAGASVPYGFPIGADLVKSIQEIDPNDFAVAWRPDLPLGLDERNRVSLDDLELGYVEGKRFAAFKDKLRQADPPSIDAFLEHWSEDYGVIGKTAIVMALGPKEQESVDIMNRSQPQGWYHILLDEMIRGSTVDTFGDNNLRVITYNYDRSLEYYIFSRLQGAFNGVGPTDAIDLLNTVGIVHVHGTLGAIDFADLNSKSPYERVEAPPPERFKEAAKQIALFSETKDGRVRKAYVKAMDAIGWAERIAFLGFGYLRENLDRLEILDRFPYLLKGGDMIKADSPRFRVELSGTSYGLGAVRAEQARRAFRHNITLRDMPIDQFLMEIPIFDSES